MIIKVIVDEKGKPTCAFVAQTDAEGHVYRAEKKGAGKRDIIEIELYGEGE